MTTQSLRWARRLIAWHPGDVASPVAVAGWWISANYVAAMSLVLGRVTAAVARHAWGCSFVGALHGSERAQLQIGEKIRLTVLLGKTGTVPRLDRSWHR